jgi:hypothetical protein
MPHTIEHWRTRLRGKRPTRSRPAVSSVAATRSSSSRVKPMGRQAGVVLYVLTLVAVVVGVDVLFFRHRFWERLLVNVGIVLMFAAFYLRFLKRA